MKTKAQVGLSLGFPSLDRLLSGLRPGQLFLFGAGPGIGKTAFALSLVENLALEQKSPVGMISLEMTRKQLLVRLACSRARIDLLQFYLGKGSEKAPVKFTQTLEEIGKAPFHVFETPRINLSDLLMETRRLKTRFQIGLLVIDSLQQITAEGLPPCKDRSEELTRIAQSMKSLAGELKLPMVLLHRLDPPSEKKARSGKTLSASKLLAFEKEGDLVCRLAPNEAYEEQKGKGTEPITAEITVLKNRNGKTGTARLKFLPKFARFESKG